MKRLTSFRFTKTRIAIMAATGVVAVSIIPLAKADSLGNLSTATADSAEASARVVASGGQVALGAVAVPLAAVGGLSEATGNAAGTIAGDLWDTANAPLVVDETVVMAQPAPDVPATPNTAPVKEEER